MHLLLLSCLLALGATEQVSYEGFHLFSAGPFQTKEDAKALETFLFPHSRTRQVVFWKEYQGTRPIDFVAAPSLVNDVINYLQQHEITYDIHTTNIQSWIDQANVKSQAYWDGEAVMGNEPTDYLNYDQTITWMNNLAAANSRVSVSNIGQSDQGRSMFMMTISTGGATKPGVWIDCGIHAREWIAPSTCLWVAHKLATGYGSDTDSTWLLNNYDWYIAPVINPDGYAYSHSTDRMWRKTRRDNGDWLFGCMGVDPNRNYLTGWNAPEGGNDDEFCSESYRGPSAFSEGCQRSVRDTVLSLSNLQVFVSIHSYSQLWLVPYGYTAVRAPDYASLMAAAQVTCDAIQSVNGLAFTHGPAPEILYTAAGVSSDWAYAPANHLDGGGANIRHSYSPELRPATSGEGGFVIDRSNIQPSGREIFAGLNAKMRHLAN